jgi:hypothetical protein
VQACAFHTRGATKQVFREFPGLLTSQRYWKPFKESQIIQTILNFQSAKKPKFEI